MERAGRSRGRSGALRVFACSLGALFTIGVSASPAWAAVPDAPAKPAVTSGNAQIVVTYTAPADNGLQITSYHASCASSDGGNPGTGSYTTPDGSVSPITVTALTNGKNYTCNVTATNSDGESTASPDSDSVLVATVPDAPPKPSIAAGNAQIVVTFSAPANDGGSPINIYTASCTDGGVPVIQIGLSPITVSGLTNGNTYTCTVAATNGAGTGPPSTASDAAQLPNVPGAPAQPAAAPGNAQIVVTFTPPASNGSAITSYLASCTDGGTPVTNSGSASPITVTGLTNGNSYTCTVAATNGAGTGPASPPSAAVVPAAAPNGPAQPTATAGNAQIVVSFVPPASNGSAITNYTASCTNGGTPVTNTGSASPITVGGLTNGTSYTCDLTATNGVGTSATSAASAAAIPAAVPDAPAPPTIAPGNAQIVVTFSAPANNGSAITNYTTSCTNGGTPATNSGSASPITVTGLTNGTSYTCNVTATNGAGTSLASADSASAIPSGAPSAPAQPTVARGFGQIVVTFSAPANNGSAITGYNATCTSSDGGATGTGSLSGATATPITVTPLTQGKTYTCNVTAANGVGTSAPSANSVAIVVGVPNAPAQPTVAPGNGQILVTFLTPADHGTTITGYQATCTSSDGGATGTASISSVAAAPITVGAVTNGKTYTCSVTATNGVGTSPQSVPSAPVVPAPLPDAPAQPGVAADNAQIVVTFTAPANNGNAITGYAASCVSSDGGVSGTQSLSGATPSPITVTGLTNANTYTCTVTATNIIGTSPPSPPSTGAVPATVPAPPDRIVAVSGDAALRVSFSAKINNGSAFTNFTATCFSSTGGAFSPMSGSGPGSPITVTGVSNGYLYTCRVNASNALGTSPDSVASNAVIVGVPGVPTALSVVSGPAEGKTGSLKVSFTAAPGNGGPVDQYAVTCTPVTSGATLSDSGPASPVSVTGLLVGHTYSCTVFAHNFRGTGKQSAAATGTVGTPSRPIVVGVMQLAHGLAFAVAPPANNGSAITDYRARCTSSDGGAPSSPVQLKSPVVANNLTVGKSYTCLLFAVNAHGQSPPTTIGPTIVASPQALSLATCTGHGGNMRVAPGLQLSVNNPHSLELAATLGSCTGPYVRKAQMKMSFRSKSGYSCKHAIGIPNAGSGTVTWTAPAGRGTSDASIQLEFAATKGHTTTAHFHGVVTSRSNIFSDARITGTLTMQRGLGAAVNGGDCDALTRLQKFIVTSVTMTIS